MKYVCRSNLYLHGYTLLWMTLTSKKRHKILRVMMSIMVRMMGRKILRVTMSNPGAPWEKKFESDNEHHGQNDANKDWEWRWAKAYKRRDGFKGQHQDSKCSSLSLSLFAISLLSFWYIVMHSLWWWFTLIWPKFTIVVWVPYHALRKYTILLVGFENWQECCATCRHGKNCGCQEASKCSFFSVLFSVFL